VPAVQKTFVAAAQELVDFCGTTTDPEESKPEYAERYNNNYHSWTFSKVFFYLFAQLFYLYFISAFPRQIFHLTLSSKTFAGFLRCRLLETSPCSTVSENAAAKRLRSPHDLLEKCSFRELPSHQLIEQTFISVCIKHRLSHCNEIYIILDDQ